MTKQDVIDFQNKKKESYKKELIKNQTIHGTINGFSNSEFEKSMKDVQSRGKKGQKVKYSQNRIFNYYNEPQHNEFEIVLGGKIYKKVVR